jgi:hypothetical protein
LIFGWDVVDLVRDVLAAGVVELLAGASTVPMASRRAGVGPGGGGVREAGWGGDQLSAQAGGAGRGVPVVGDAPRTSGGGATRARPAPSICGFQKSA